MPVLYTFICDRCDKKVKDLPQATLPDGWVQVSITTDGTHYWCAECWAKIEKRST